MISRTLYTLLLIFSALRLEAREQEVAIRNTAGGITLAGTLSTPENSVIKGAVVLASGSGAQNRDEEIMGLRPFKVLADTLSAAGYAVLRMDDRGTADSEGDFQSSLLADFDSDIAAALSYLDSCCVGVPKGIIGHSQGGITAIRLAGAKSLRQVSPDFIITLGVPAWKGDSLIMAQSRALSMAMTGNWAGEHLQRKILDIAQSSMTTTMASTLIYSMVAKEIGDLATHPKVQAQISAQVSAVTAPAYREMLRYDPQVDIRAVKTPWLAINGDRDLQVPPANLQVISSINPTAATLLLPGHNHLFQVSTTGLPQDYPYDGQSPSSDTLSAIIQWLDIQTNKTDRAHRHHSQIDPDN